MRPDKKRVLMSGAAGFIGSHLCRLLLEQGFSVDAYDNLRTGSKANLVGLLDNPAFRSAFRFHQHDVTQPINTDSHVDIVMHLAALASPTYYFKYPLESLRVGSEGTYQLLELARANKAKFLFTSTSEVYGDPLEHPQKETYRGSVNPIGLRSVYDESKRFSESMVITYHREYGMDTKIVRIFNTYGPHMAADDGRAIPSFISAALRNKPLIIFGDGTYTRSLCYIDDLIDGLVRMVQSTEHGPINLGNPEEVTMNDLAHTIIALTGSTSTILHKPAREDDPTRRKPDITLAKQKLAWQPQTSLGQGLTKTIDYFRQR
ncbi:MAG: hypothetical protein A2666_00565 [Parcubacteria group bacterium RIFCSPHIGHO2_01_FULL_47_10b]|nr:MAG: hypothetical protein A2666_00565 [Parcubacteria group bacterium RIFCSPHIGHO2_01_FULL_47_10b]